jgi:hypothetical protein
MPLTPAALDTLTSEYHRLIDEAQQAIVRYRTLHGEALELANFLRSGGRNVPFPTELLDIPAEFRRRPSSPRAEQEWPFNGDPSASTLEAAILRVLSERAGGFKPSEMAQRIVKKGFPFSYDLGDRVTRALNELEQLGDIVRGSDGRYKPFDPDINLDSSEGNVGGQA